MQITNKTNYDTRTMSRVFRVVFTSVAKSIGQHTPHFNRSLRRSLCVEVKYVREGYGYTGSARSNWMILRLPRNELFIPMLAWLFDHEVRHNHGHDHGWKKFPKHMMHVDDEQAMKTHGWVLEKLSLTHHTITENEPEKKPKPTNEEKQAQKIARLLERRKAWLTKKKRADNAIKKINKSLKYYQRQGFDIDV